jgi:glycosyltransferase involved in cell wall biosynthesis
MEIRIYDDGSTDGTWEIIGRFMARDARIRAERGIEALPEGWNGKNHACHRLSQAAAGDYLLFLDSDVRVEPTLVTRAIDLMQAHDLALLSLFPRQMMLTRGEMLTVPIMNWILLSMLPLRLVRLSHYPSLAAANGQFMLFRGREYRQHNFHSLIRDINVEDIHIVRKIKKMGYTAETLLSREEISCRMYTGYRDGIFGFTRSIFAFFGGSGLAMFLFTVFATFGFIFVWVGMSFYWALFYITLAVLLKGMVASMSRQHVARSLLLSPLVQVSFLWIVVHSFRMKYRGTSSWKGRTIRFKGI